MRDFQIGIQMYTIREALWQDFRGVCREIAKLGCDGVELAFYFGEMEPAELAAFFREIGIRACGMHVKEAELYDQNSKMWEYAEALNVPFLSLSMFDDFSKCEGRCLEMCRKAGAEAKKHGCVFTYHNHHNEIFMQPDGVRPYDRIMAACSPEEVKCELDVYWLKKGGVEPVDYIRKYADRLVQLHLKDMDADGAFEELGKGTMDLKGCIEAAEKTPCNWLIYEQDVCKRPPFECAVASIAHLKKLLGK